MTVCPNSNIIFDNFFYKLNLIDPLMTNEQKAERRKYLYYHTCIPVRLIILVFLFTFKDTSWLPYLVLLSSLIASINILFFRKQDNQWWSNKITLSVSLLLLLSSFMIVLKYNIPRYFIPLIFLMSIIVGIFQSTLQPFC